MDPYIKLFHMKLGCVIMNSWCGGKGLCTGNETLISEMLRYHNKICSKGISAVCTES